MHIPIHKQLEPFFGVYDQHQQPHLLDMPEPQLTFDYIKWRPKLVQQLYHLNLQGWLDTHTELSTSTKQRLSVLCEQFESCEWHWTPPMTVNAFQPKHNELHDIPIEWQIHYQIERMKQKIQELGDTVGTLLQEIKNK